MLKHEYIDYGYFGRCLKVYNESMEALITVDKGPRVISLKCPGMENIMCEDTNENSTMSGGRYAEVFGDKKWYIYGGHRIWFSPEHDPKSYYPDNDPVMVKQEGNRFIFTPPEQYETGLQFELILDFDETAGKITATHTIKNTGDETQNIAVWAMTVVDHDSIAILPQCDKPTGLLPNRTYTVWPYSDMHDDRLMFGNRFITIKQSDDCKTNFKLGFNDDKGYMAMWGKGQLFTKRFEYIEGAQYPDNGCNCECFTNFFMMEIESLSPLYDLEPNETMTHTEHWEIRPCNDSFDRKDEQSVAAFMERNVRQ
ncbi:MAG: hypothetical protein IKR76_02670 [Ruminococcus sp.]|nr:hypothetical protein [Ruminococcus sp.]